MRGWLVVVAGLAARETLDAEVVLVARATRASDANLETSVRTESAMGVPDESVCMERVGETREGVVWGA